MESLFLLMLVIIAVLSVVKIYSLVKTITLHLEKIYSRIHEHAKMTEEAHKHNLDEKKRSGK